VSCGSRRPTWLFDPTAVRDGTQKRLTIPELAAR
jgi:hypothetical protein